MESLSDDTEDIEELGDLSADFDEIAEPEEIDLSELDSPVEEFELGDEIDLTSPEEDIPELGGIEELSLDDEGGNGEMQFSLDDFGDEFNFQEGISFDDDMDASLDSLDTLGDTFLMEDQDDLENAEEEIFEISEENMVSLQDTLRILPLNLKLAIQDALAQAELTGERYQKMVELLIKGSSPRQISAEFYNITGKKIELPRGYQKQSGREFEIKKIGFFYQFKEKGWPFVRLTFMILIALGFTVFVTFQFIYRPLQAMVFYNQGLDKIEEYDFDEAENLFHKAYFGWPLGNFIEIEGWPLKKRFIEYAEAYSAQRDYTHASKMYEGLIGEFRDYLDGYLKYGKFLTDVTGDYEKSAEILSLGLDQSLHHYKLMLALGDNYMRWSEEDPAKLEEARYQYASVLARYRNRDEVVLRMLRYFLARKDDHNIRMLGNIFNKKSTIKADSYFSSETLSLLGGYFIDTNNVSEAKDFLFKAEKINETVPEVHYQLSRYFNKTYNLGQEKSALQKALYFIDQKAILSTNQVFMKIGIYRRRGELHFLEASFDLAENEYSAGIRLLEDSQERGLIGTSSDVGGLYADMGDLHYDILNDLNSALEYYLNAEKNQYSNGDISYKKGYIYYDQQEFDQAVLEFEKSLERMEEKRSSRYALANTMVKRRNLFGARNLYRELLRELKLEESNLPYLIPEDIIEHRSLMNYFILVYNNLAYVEYQLSLRSRDPGRQSQALVYLAKAADYADRLDRDPETGIRSRPEDSQETTTSNGCTAPGRDSPDGG
ncbi:MAG: hypothetical protein B6241_13205 [Spirochaetaceae bacterium 4572_59]|nr:MAG: hypothetical protein B6241_13205 [Spirochaetaceae bacterium 4572_59]